METLIVLALIVTLAVNLFYVNTLLLLVRFLSDSKANSEQNAVSLKEHKMFEIYLMGPMMSSNLKRTADGKYWYEERGWKVTRLTILGVFLLILFVNIFLLLYFVTAL